MRALLTMVALCFCFSATAQAMLPVSEFNVKNAQVYAEKNKDIPVSTLMKRWTVQDSRKQNKYGNNEHIIIYTPYLVSTISAHAKVRKKLVPNVAEGLALAKEYEGILAVGVIIDSNVKVDAKSLKVEIMQENKKFAPYNITLDSTSIRGAQGTAAANITQKKEEVSKVNADTVDKEKLAQVKREVEQKTKELREDKQHSAQKKNTAAAPLKPVQQLWNMQFFVYFDLAQLNINKLMVMTVAENGGGVREFEIDLRGIN